MTFLLKIRNFLRVHRSISMEDKRVRSSRFSRHQGKLNFKFITETYYEKILSNKDSKPNLMNSKLYNLHQNFSNKEKYWLKIQISCKWISDLNSLKPFQNLANFKVRLTDLFFLSFLFFFHLYIVHIDMNKFSNELFIDVK